MHRQFVLRAFFSASLALLFELTISGLVGLGSLAQDKPIVGLITKSEGNPFFVKMREGAQAKAEELGLDLRSYAGEFDGDNEGQIAAIESLIAAGAKGFAIVPSDPSAIVPTVQQARDAGLMVIVLDNALDPIEAADATIVPEVRALDVTAQRWSAQYASPSQICVIKDRSVDPSADDRMKRIADEFIAAAQLTALGIPSPGSCDTGGQDGGGLEQATQLFGENAETSTVLVLGQSTNSIVTRGQGIATVNATPESMVAKALDMIAQGFVAPGDGMIFADIEVCQNGLDGCVLIPGECSVCTDCKNCPHCCKP